MSHIHKLIQPLRKEEKIIEKVLMTIASKSENIFLNLIFSHVLSGYQLVVCVNQCIFFMKKKPIVNNHWSLSHHFNNTSGSC